MNDYINKSAIRNTHQKDKPVFDKEQVSKTVIFLKGIGRRCEVCNKHIFGDPRKKVCGQKCRRKKAYLKNGKQQDLTGVHAFITLRKSQTTKPYRIIKLYLKKGIIEEVRITPESKELWSLLEKIEQFRDISKPLEILA